MMMMLLMMMMMMMIMIIVSNNFVCYFYCSCVFEASIENLCDNSWSQVDYSTCQRAPQGTVRRTEIQTLYVKASSRQRAWLAQISQPDSVLKKSRASGGHKKCCVLKWTNKHVSLFRHCFQDKEEPLKKYEIDMDLTLSDECSPHMKRDFSHSWCANTRVLCIQSTLYG